MESELEKDVKEYLWHGYLPEYDLPHWFEGAGLCYPSNDSYTPHEAARLLDRLFDRIVETTPPPMLFPLVVAGIAVLY